MAGIKCCYQCPDRYPGCHSKCDKYIAEKAQWEIDKQKIKESIAQSQPVGKLDYDINFTRGNKGRGRRKS